MLNEYLNDKSSGYNHPLVVYNDSKTGTQNQNQNQNVTYFNILMSKWLNKLIESNSKKNEIEPRTSIIYRYCNHSILSADLTTLLQNVLHQLCYIIEVHESCAFDVSYLISYNIS